MAVVMEFIASTGARVRVHDDDLAPDQEAAWREAYKVKSRIFWENKRREAKEAARAAQAKPQ